jgi:replication fork clamp-binding protein CrfC
MRYAVLRERIASVVTELLAECRRPCRDMIRDLVLIELAFINTAHPDFSGSVGAINNIVEKTVEERVALRKVEWMNAYETKRREEDIRNSSVAANTNTRTASTSNPPQNTSSSSSASTRQPPLTASSLTPSFGSYNPFASSTNKTQQTQAQQQLAQQQQAKQQKKAVAQLDHVPLTIKAEGALSEREQMETDLIRSLLESYFVIVRKNVQDGVPKTIMHFLVMRGKQGVHNRLVERLYKEDLFAELLSEAPEVAQRRKAIRDMVEMLKRAREILNEVRDFTMK